MHHFGSPLILHGDISSSIAEALSSQPANDMQVLKLVWVRTTRVVRGSRLLNRECDYVCLGWGTGLCVLNKFPVNCDARYLKTTF